MTPFVIQALKMFPMSHSGADEVTQALILVLPKSDFLFVFFTLTVCFPEAPGEFKGSEPA